MKCLIKQPAGLGDILFCQKIATNLIELGYDIIWPVKSHYSIIKDYIINDKINFVDENDEFEFKSVYTRNSVNFIQTDDFLYLPLQSVNQHDFANCKTMMDSKYEFCQMDCTNWEKSINLKRNFDRENTLKDFLEIKKGDKYNLINNIYGTPPMVAKNNNIVPDNEYRNIFLTINNWDNVFDWIGVAENSVSIHTVETSLCYLLKIANIDTNVNVYERIEKDNVKYTLPTDKYLHQFIFSDNWKYYINLTKDGFNY